MAGCGESPNDDINGVAMSIDDSHWLAGARQSPCVNYNDRPNGVCDIGLIVVHCISLPAGIYGTGCVEQLFANSLDCHAHPDFASLQSLDVSAHLLITRTGELVQFVSFDKRAWHAGASHFQGRDNCNDFSIGIEVEGVEDVPFEQVQYQQLVRVCQLLFERYPSLADRQITGHSDIAVPAGRKSDPGSAFDWDAFRDMLARRSFN